ncbi:histidine kinase [Microlunatus capsulatus]|uniref:histidine kinase n=1 Tax=Microlunatus capsulatus TaxID=99117 RepID=A0ABS4ZDD8_9ACTN|nr:histidine kinase [Microlunatus capsulatus]MBP2419047.1 two-component system sensor histidine kinase UhpB [Microlunatus capsulatus]
MASFSSLPVYWRVCLINAALFLLATVILVVSPTSVGPDMSLGELGVLAVGLGAIMVANALLLRSSLVPLDRLVGQMQRMDLQGLGERLPDTRDGSLQPLVTSFNAMSSRLELERARSNAVALAAQEAERHRIARELHDEIGQGLTVVLLGLQRAVADAPPALADELRTVQETARASLHEVREVARRLRPGLLQDLGLVSALSALATDLTTSTGTAVDRRFDARLPPLSEEQELVLYRVAQEALTNAARHAGARHVRLQLGVDPDGVELVVADDGRGLDGSPEGSGLRGMRERALLVGGRLAVRSPGTGGGTEIRLRVPVRAEVPA